MENQTTIGSRELPEKHSEAKLSIEKEDVENLEGLDFYTLSFLRGRHIDIPDLADFDPVWELAEIRKIVRRTGAEDSSAQRMLLVDDFRGKMKILRLNLSRGQVELENFLRADPQVKKEEAADKLGEIIKHFHLQSYAASFYLVLDRFFKDAALINKFVDDYKTWFPDKWPEELFAKVFGQHPRGRVTVDVLPTSIYFEIWNNDDYTLAHGGEKANVSGGASKHDLPHCPELNGKVLIENSNVSDESYRRDIRIHEEEHSIHNFFPTSTTVSREQKAWAGFKNGETRYADWLDLLEQLAPPYSKDWEQYSRGEILAYLKEGCNIRAIEEMLLSENQDSLYFYPKDWGDEEGFVDYVHEHLKRYLWNVKFKNEDGQDLTQEEAKTSAREVLNQNWQNHRQKISRGLKIAASLLGKYSLDEVLRILSQEPLYKWPRLAI